MKILIITNSVTPFAPNDVMFFRAAKLLLKSGHNIFISPFDWGDHNSPRYVELKDLGAQVDLRPRHALHPQPLVRLFQRVRRRLSDPLCDYQFIETIQPHLILLNDPGTYSILGNASLSSYLLKLKVPLAIMSHYNDEHSVLTPEVAERARLFFTAAAAVFFVSHRNLDTAQRQLCITLGNAIVVDNPPDFDDYTPVPYPSSEIALMALVARLDCQIKCQDLVIDALAGEVWKDRNWQLTLYGAGPDEDYLRRLVEFRNLQGKVIFGGFSKSIREIWAHQQLLVLCSSGEGKPLAITEAMICGRPSVVTDVGGNAELIEEGQTGFVAAAPTVTLIHEALERAWQQRMQWAAIGQQAHQAIMQRLTPRPENQFADHLVRLASN